MIRSNNFRYEIWLLASLMLALVAFQGSRGLYETTEGRYAECARQTMLRGNLAEPYLNGDYHWTKPPLTYIAIATGLRVLGVNTWGARAFLIPVFLLTVVVVYAAGRLLWDRETGLLCAMVYASSPFTIASSYTVSTDMLLSLWEACAVLCFWLGARRGEARWMILMWLSFGVAFMTKGPPALLALIAIAVVFVMMRKRGEPCPNLFNPAGLAVFAVVGFSWYLYESVKHPGLLSYWLKDEVVNRNISDEFHRNPHFSYVLYSYVPLLLFGAGPWVYFIARHFRRLGLASGKSLVRRLWHLESLVWTYLVLAVLIPFVIFSVSKSKLPLYLLPLFMPISLMIGRGIRRLVVEGAVRMKTVWIVYGCMLLIFAGCKAVIPFASSDKDMKQLAARVLAAGDNEPGRKIYLLYDNPMNGLQFYLQRQVPTVAKRQVAGLLKEAGKNAEPITVIMKSNKLDDFQEYTSQPGFRQLDADQKWALIVSK